MHGSGDRLVSLLLNEALGAGGGNVAECQSRHIQQLTGAIHPLIRKDGEAQVAI